MPRPRKSKRSCWSRKSRAIFRPSRRDGRHSTAPAARITPGCSLDTSHRAPQEQVLQGLPGVEEVNGNANSGGSQVFLTFAIGTDMKAALVDVIGRMSRLPPLPRDSDRPCVTWPGRSRLGPLPDRG